VTPDRGFRPSAESPGFRIGWALGKTWDALKNNKDLHKGALFGGKAAWEVRRHPLRAGSRLPQLSTTDDNKLEIRTDA
jgi:hypothetical protein